MKWLYILLSVIPVILLPSCSGYRYPQQLVLADSLSDKDPEKAIALLDSIKPQITNAGKAVKNYYSLLRIKIDDKTYIKHKSDTTILRLVDYYEQGGDKHLLPTAYYYAGRVYFELNNYPEALKYFQNTINLLADDAPLKYKAYSQMGYIFLYQDLYDKGIEAFTEAYKYNKEKGNKSNQIYELCGIAYCYQRKNNDNIAIKYFKKALVLSHEIRSYDQVTEITTQIANHYYRLKEYAKAKKYIQQIMGRKIAGKSLLSVYSIASDIYYKTGQKDSAVILYKRIYAAEDIYAKHFAAKRLGFHYLREKSPLALIFLKEYESASDSIQEIIQTQTVAKVNALYNYQLKENENVSLKAEVKEREYTVLITILLSITAILSLSSYTFYIRRKRQTEHIKSSNLERLLQEQYKESKAYIEENVKKINELNALIADLKDNEKNSISKFRQEEERLKNMNRLAKIKIANKNLAKEGFETSEIYNKVRKLYDSNIPDYKKRLSREDWENLDIEVNRHFPDFRKVLLETCGINDYEYKICLLIKINISPVGIAIFVNKTKAAVSLVRKRLCKKVFNHDASPNEWDDFIRSL